MINRIKELDKIRKILLIIIFITVLSFFKLGLKNVVNEIFIKNYPDHNNEIELKFISFLNISEPYIAPYNYGNYYYQLGEYRKAYEKYILSLSHHIPLKRLCKVHINTSLALIKLSEQENDSETKLNYLNEAYDHLSVCAGGEGDGDASIDGDNDGKKDGDNNHSGNQDKDEEGDKEQAKQLEEAIKTQIENIGKTSDKIDDVPTPTDSQTSSPQKTDDSKTQAQLESIEKETTKGVTKREKTFQKQSYNNQGQYGQQTPGSGCIGTCW